MADILRFLDEQVFPFVSRAEILQNLEPEDRGAYFSLRCPACKQRRARIDRHGFYMTCSPSEGCTYTCSLWRWVRMKTGGSSRDALEHLAGMAAASLPPWESAWEGELDEPWELYDLREAAMAFFRAQLFRLENSVGLQCLMDLLLLPAEAIAASDLGFYPPPKAVEAFLKERFHSKREGVKAGLLPAGGGTEYFSVLPIRDPLGRIMCFQVRAMAGYLRARPRQLAAFREVHGREAALRAVLPANERIFTPPERPEIFGGWHRARGCENIVVAFDPLLAEAAHRHGITGVVSTLESEIREVQLEDAKARGARTVVLVPWGTDGDGILMSRYIQRILALGLKCRVAGSGGRSDPQALFRDLSREEAEKEIAGARPAIHWQIDQILDHSCYKPQNERDWKCAMNECVTLLATAEDPGERTAGVDYLVGRTGILPRALTLLAENLALHMRVVAQKNQYKKALEEATGTRPSYEEGPKPARYLN